MAKKWPKFTKWPEAFFHGQRTLKMAKFFEIGHEMANLATLHRCLHQSHAAIRLLPQLEVNLCCHVTVMQ